MPADGQRSASPDGAPPRVQVVTDSMADLPPQWVDELDVTVVPLHVLFGETSYRDGVDLTHAEFFDMLRRRTDVIARTSHPGPGDFLEVYRQVVRHRPTSGIVSIHASSEISATYRSALMASREFVEVPVRVVDTRQVSMAEGFAVREAARAALAGAAPEEVASAAQTTAGQIGIRFTVETLEYLQRNGRIGKAQAFVGGLLQLKPVLAFEEGMVTPVERVRGRANSLQRLVELVAGAVGEREVTIAVIHGDVPEEAEALAQRVEQRCRVRERMVTTLGATIGTHAGPGTIGIVYWVHEG